VRRAPPLPSSVWLRGAGAGALAAPLRMPSAPSVTNSRISERTDDCRVAAVNVAAAALLASTAEADAAATITDVDDADDDAVGRASRPMAAGARADVARATLLASMTRGARTPFCAAARAATSDTAAAYTGRSGENCFEMCSSPSR
jgi:hypothetical protein